MAGTLVLVAWCFGIAAGYLGVLAVPGPGLPLAMALAVLGGLAWLAGGGLAGSAGWLQAILLLAASVGLLGVVRGDAGRPPTGPGSVAAYVGQTLTASGTVEAAGLPNGGPATNPAARLQSFHLVVTGIEAGGRQEHPVGAVLVQGRGQAEVFDGQRVRVRGSLSRPRQLGPGGVSGYADRLERQGVLAEMSATSVMPLDAPPPISLTRLAAGARASLVTAIRDAIPEPEATVVLGELAGIRGNLPAEVDADLVQSGLVHILAISGIKVAIVAGLLQAVARPLMGRRGAVLSIAGIALYTVVGGATASALRSALMGSLGLLGGAIRRDTDVMRSLLLAAAAMLALRPALVSDLSFQYSFLGVLGIHVFAEPIGRRVGWAPEPFRSALAVTAAAQVGTLPLTAHYFAVLPLLAPVANALVLPTLPAAILGGLAIAALHAGAGLAPPGAGMRLAAAASVAPAALVFALARLALWTAHLARSTPVSAIATPGFGASATAGYYAAIAVVALGTARRWQAPMIAALATSLALGTLLVLGRPDGRLHVVFPGGVTGPAAVVVAPDGATMLVDTGASAAALTPSLDAALPISAPLPGLPRRLDAVALTGTTRDEAGGLDGVASRRVAAVMAPDAITGAAAKGMARLAGAGAQEIRLRPGDIVPWHGLDLVTWPAGGAGEVALELRFGHTRVLVVSSSDARAVPSLPPGDYAVVALGGGAADPGLDGVNVASVVVQNGAAGSAAPAHPVARGIAQAVGQRLWQSSRDGELRVACDQRGCTRG